MTEYVPLKRVARLAYGDALASEKRVDGDYPVVGSGGVSGTHNRRNFCAPGIVIGRKGSYGSVHWIPGGGFAIDTSYFIDKTCTKVDLRWLYYALQAVDLRGVSQDVGVPGLSRESAYGVALPVPGDFEGQRRVADFLDCETVHIDLIINSCHRLRALLDERDSALLDLMLDSLAETAEVVPLRRFVLGMDQGSSPQCDAVPAGEGEWGVLKVSCLRPGVFSAEENKRLPEGANPNVRDEVREGDLLVTRANTPQLVGSTAVVPVVRRGLLLSDKIFRVRLSGDVNPRYVATVARGSRIRAMCSASSNGASQSMANIRFEEVLAWPIPKVDLATQQEVVARMGQVWQQTRELRMRISRQLDLLAERRTALITAAVTGQIDVSSASGRGIED